MITLDYGNKRYSLEKCVPASNTHQLKIHQPTYRVRENFHHLGITQTVGHTRYGQCPSYWSFLFSLLLQTSYRVCAIMQNIVMGK